MCPVTHVMAPVDAALRAKFFRGLANPSRLALLDALRGSELTAGEVATRAGLSLSNASKHLACLKACGFVETRQDWRRVHYRLADEVDALLAANDAFLGRVAERVAACERPEMGSR